MSHPKPMKSLFGPIDPRLRVLLRRSKVPMCMWEYWAVRHNRFAGPTGRYARVDAARQFRLDDAFKIVPPRA
jgi:hypothetical protein